MRVSKTDQMSAFIWKNDQLLFFYALQLTVILNVLFHLIDFLYTSFHLIGFELKGSKVF